MERAELLCAGGPKPVAFPILAASPSILSTTALDPDPETVGATLGSPVFVNSAETRAYILNRGARLLQVYDVTDNTNPVFLNEIATDPNSSPESIVTSNGFGFIAETFEPTGSTLDVLEIFNVSLCQ